MTDARLSFRLPDGSHGFNTWNRLVAKNYDKSLQFIFDELLRREQIRIDHKVTHSDLLAGIKQQVEGVSTADLKELLLTIIERLESNGDKNDATK